MEYGHRKDFYIISNLGLGYALEGWKDGHQVIPSDHFDTFQIEANALVEDNDVS